MCKPAWTVAAETSHRLETWKQQQSAKPKTAKRAKSAAGLFADQVAFAKAFRELVKSQSVPENIPYAVDWETLEKKMKIPAAVKSIRGKLNVPRERFRVKPDGLYVVAGL